MMSPTLIYEAPSLPQGQIAAPPPGDNQRLGLHVTTDELTIWQDRAVNGPYKTAGDVSTNSPGDWDRIESEAISGTGNFLNNPTADRYTGSNLTPGGGPFTGGSGGTDSTAYHTKMLSAALYILVNSTYASRQTIADNIITELLYEAGQANLDFADNTLWQVTPNYVLADTNPYFTLFPWVARLVECYDIVLAAASLGIVTGPSQANKDTIEAWFHDCGVYLTGWIYLRSCSSIFSDAGSVAHDELPVTFINDGSCGSSSGVSGGPVIYVDGADNPSPSVFNRQLQWSNRKAEFLWTLAVIGTLLKDHLTYATDAADMIARAKQYVKCWMAYTCQEDGTPIELYRWLDSNPCLGWAYAGACLQKAVLTANLFARAGDTTLIDFSTTKTLAPSGGNCTVTNNTTKTLLSITQNYCNYVDGTIQRYAPGHAGVANYKIDSVDDVASSTRVHDIWMAAANLYWQDSYYQSVYMRTASGAPAYPSTNLTPAGQGFTAWHGGNSTCPGILFMFGQMEGQVDPYL